MAFTFFFRDSHTLEQGIKYLLPLISGLRNIRIWDAGCAMGQEPYTFAILLAEKMGYFAFKNVSIDATDIDETNTFCKIITDAVYPVAELSRIPKDIYEKYFEPAGIDGLMRVHERIKSKVIFKKNNLLDFQPVNQEYSLIICKNVLLHFQPDERIKVMKMFYSSLSKDGLFITEQTQAMPEELNPLFKKIASDANIYQKINS